jgi:hypothetical protein
MSEKKIGGGFPRTLKTLNVSATVGKHFFKTEFSEN